MSLYPTHFPYVILSLFKLDNLTPFVVLMSDYFFNGIKVNNKKYKF